MTAVLELDQVAHEFHGTPVLHGLSFAVQRGEMIAIQGPSGSGKSTLLYIMGCLLRPQHGILRIDGRDVNKLSPDQRACFRGKKIGFVFQQFHLLPKANILENILLATHYQEPNGRGTRQKARELAESLGLGDRLMHLPNQLSGGQQQRVAIARALMNDPSIILADEPTGNLDSKSSQQIVELLKTLNRQGKTVVIITHDSSVAKSCEKILHIRDGKLVEPQDARIPAGDIQPISSSGPEKIRPPAVRFSMMLPLAMTNLSRHKIRSLLTMLGITIGIAAVLTLVTLGQFTKKKILASYADLGVNTLAFYGHENYDMRATDVVPVMFRTFDVQKDLIPLRRVFPEITRLSPVMHGWEVQAIFGGKRVDQDVRMMGVGTDALPMTQREFLVGQNFNPYQIEKKSAVCILGFELGERLFSNTPPIGKILYVRHDQESFACRVIGVLKSASSSKEWMKPNMQLLLPYTFFQTTVGNTWAARIRQLLIEVHSTFDVEKTGKNIRKFFEMKYGKSGEFRVDTDSVLVAQMQKFLNLFTIMLATIAFVTLSVGGVGITNMMLVAVSERFREIGLRKALGATNQHILLQFLVESMVLCLFAGLVGILLGFVGYQAGIYAATKFVNNFQFEWVFDKSAFALAMIAIASVGVLSGLFPALKAERLQVIEALRAE